MLQGQVEQSANDQNRRGDDEKDPEKRAQGQPRTRDAMTVNGLEAWSEHGRFSLRGTEGSQTSLTAKY